MQSPQVRVIELIKRYSSLETSAQSGFIFFPGVGDEYFLDWVQVFNAWGNSFFCTQIEPIGDKGCNDICSFFLLIKPVLKFDPERLKSLSFKVFLLKSNEVGRVLRLSIDQQHPQINCVSKLALF